MNAKATIRKIFFISLWLVIGAGLITLLAAAMRRQNNGICKDYRIDIRDAGSDLFINESEITGLLNRAAGGDLKGHTLSGFNLQKLEKELESNTWVEDAEIYFDSKDVMHVIVRQKKPIARIFTLSGNSYYIDSALRKLPLSDKVSARLPVFTGFPDRGTWLSRDSILIGEVKNIAQYILTDAFWMSQVSQVDIGPNREFEIIPLVGDHVIRLGKPEDLSEKFARLFLFYKKVLTQTGLNKYPVIDVQFKDQVIGIRTNEKRVVDSVQLRRNVEKLLRSNSISLKENIESNKQNPGKNVNPSVETTLDPNPVKASSVSLPANNRNGEKKVPKAIMPPSTGQSLQENKPEE